MTPPLFFQSQLLRESSIPPGSQYHVAWPQVRCGCDAKAPGQSHGGPNSFLVRKPQPWALLPQGWATGVEVLREEDKVPGLPSWKVGIFFRSTSCAKKPAKLQNAISPQSGCKADFKAGESTANWESASAFGTAIPSMCRHIKGGELLRSKKNLCTMKSTVEKNYFLKSILDND